MRMHIINSIQNAFHLFESFKETRLLKTKKDNGRLFYMFIMGAYFERFTFKE